MRSFFFEWWVSKRYLKPKNKEIQGLSKAIMDISLYVIQLQTDLNTNKEAVSDYRYRKNTSYKNSQND